MQTRAAGGMLSMVIVVHPGSVVLPVGLGWAACGLPVGQRHGAFAAQGRPGPRRVAGA